ncbi:GNAT family N-acetyltransferase [Nostocoides sp. F2B08]|uniref:GNAT family N-acetyltransferase n=1 Tax=Nostocoides sp. F2B08 TaxID=2653936 RepID=UPI001D050067|nr:GNAT family N-acetyltransferase [Tetrasphaera sp. F2B08]
MGQAFWIDTPAPAEAPEVARVHVRTWRETYGDILADRFYGATALQWRTQFWTRVLTSAGPDYPAAVARTPDGIVGLALTGPTRPPPGFSRRAPEQLFILYVLAAWHGRGVGQALLDTVLDARTAELWVARDNLRARVFYTRNGFEPDGDERVDADFDGLVEVRMVRGLRDEDA